MKELIKLATNIAIQCQSKGWKEEELAENTGVPIHLVQQFRELASLYTSPHIATLCTELDIDPDTYDIIEEE